MNSKIWRNRRNAVNGYLGTYIQINERKMDIIELNFLFQIRQIKDMEKQEKLSEWENIDK